MVLAETWGVLPSAVEQEDEYWIARALTYLEGKARNDQRMMKARK